MHGSYACCCGSSLASRLLPRPAAGGSLLIIVAYYYYWSEEQTTDHSVPATIMHILSVRPVVVTCLLLFNVITRSAGPLRSIIVNHLIICIREQKVCSYA
jgi:hypothetical protein